VVDFAGRVRVVRVVKVLFLSLRKEEDRGRVGWRTFTTFTPGELLVISMGCG
jgi:hypothetical protein